MPAESSQWRPQSMNWDGYSTPLTDPKHLTVLGSGVVDGNEDDDEEFEDDEEVLRKMMNAVDDEMTLCMGLPVQQKL